VVLDLRLDQKIDAGASGCCTHACIAASSGDTMEGLRRCTAVVQSSADEFHSQTLGQLNWEAPMGSDWCILILSPEWNADNPRHRLLTAVARLSKRNRFVQVGVHGGRLIYGGGWIRSARASVTTY
jgi:hypothetical protein